MATRGRKSTASLSVIAGGKSVERLDPPETLNDQEADIWRRTVAGEPEDFFATAAVQQLLADYCRHVVTGSRLTDQIEAHMGGDTKDEDRATLRELDLLLRMRDRETRAAADVATKLRLTNQSRYTPQAAGTAGRNAPKKGKPWDAR